jgi:hypothetical protein
MMLGGQRLGKLGAKRPAAGSDGSSVPEWTLVGSVSDELAFGTGNVNIDLPGAPAAGDAVIVGCSSDSGLSGSFPAPNPGGGSGGISDTDYTFLATDLGAAPGVHAAFRILGETPDLQVELAEDNDEMVYVIQVWRCSAGIHGTPLDNDVSNVNGGVGMPDPGAHTTATPYTLRIIMGFLDDDSVVATAPEGFGQLETIAGTGTPCTLAIASMVSPAAGEVNPDAFGGSGDDAWRALHFAFRPAV